MHMCLSVLHTFLCILIYKSMVKINLAPLKGKVVQYVNEYYKLDTKPTLEDLQKDEMWINAMVAPYVEYAVTSLELSTLPRIEVSERVVGYDFSPAQQSCIKKKGYEIEERLGDYSDKYVLKGRTKTAKVSPIALWKYKQKDEMKSMIHNEFVICKKAEALGIGPKVYDAFICFNDAEKRAYKVVVTEFIKGVTLSDWMGGDHTKEERMHVHALVKTKIDKMHENGIIHNRLYAGNVILRTKGKNVIDAVLTDFVHSYDVKDKSLWDYNEWIRYDREILALITSKSYSFSNVDDVKLYVTRRLLENKDIVIQL